MQSRASCLHHLSDRFALAPLPALAAELDKLVTVTGEGDRRGRARRRGDPHRRQQPGQDRARGERRQCQADDRRARGHQREQHCRTRHPDLALSLQPQYDPNKSGTARLIGFQATNQVTVKIRDIGKLPAVLDSAIAAGANEMSGIEFIVSEQSKLLDQARDEAIADAHRKAELYAKAAGMKVGRVVAISEEGSAPPPRPLQALRAGARPRSLRASRR